VNSENRSRSGILAIIAVSLLAACKPGDDSAYTLYCGSVTGPMRIHVATFDSVDGEEYNSGNCDIARSLFQAQPGVTVKYWCEKGRYQKWRDDHDRDVCSRQPC
jgi:hypothetical protein